MRTAASQQQTLEALLERGGRRDHVPLRRSFVQRRERGGGAGPLASFVQYRRGRALDLYLLAHAVASAPPFDVAFPAAVWARALGWGESASAESAVSRNWSWIEDLGLVSSQRRNRMRVITLLREDGSRIPYAHPGKEGDYFKLPHAYWRGNFHNRMHLPAKAVLLIALSLREEFTLPTERGAQWYGISRDTVRKGLRTLTVLGLLRMRAVRREAPLERLGYTIERRYRLRAPFRPG